MTDNQKPINLFQTQGKGLRVKQKHSPTSCRLNLAVEPEERESFKKLQKFLGLYTGGSRVSASVMVRRMMNLYTSHLLDLTIAVDQRIEAGALPKSERQEALAKAMEPEIKALLRAGGHTMKKV